MEFKTFVFRRKPEEEASEASGEVLNVDSPRSKPRTKTGDASPAKRKQASQRGASTRNSSDSSTNAVTKSRVTGSNSTRNKRATANNEESEDESDGADERKSSEDSENEDSSVGEGDNSEDAIDEMVEVDEDDAGLPKSTLLFVLISAYRVIAGKKRKRQASLAELWPRKRSKGDEQQRHESTKWQALTCDSDCK